MDLNIWKLFLIFIFMLNFFAPNHASDYQYRKEFYVKEFKDAKNKVLEVGEDVLVLGLKNAAQYNKNVYEVGKYRDNGRYGVKIPNSSAIGVKPLNLYAVDDLFEKHGSEVTKLHLSYFKKDNVFRTTVMVHMPNEEYDGLIGSIVDEGLKKYIVELKRPGYNIKHISFLKKNLILVDTSNHYIFTINKPTPILAQTEEIFVTKGTKIHIKTEEIVVTKGTKIHIKSGLFQNDEYIETRITESGVEKNIKIHRKILKTILNVDENQRTLTEKDYVLVHYIEKPKETKKNTDANLTMIEQIKKDEEEEEMYQNRMNKYNEEQHKVGVISNECLYNPTKDCSVKLLTTGNVTTVKRQYLIPITNIVEQSESENNVGPTTETNEDKNERKTKEMANTVESRIKNNTDVKTNANLQKEKGSVKDEKTEDLRASRKAYLQEKQNRLMQEKKNKKEDEEEDIYIKELTDLLKKLSPPDLKEFKLQQRKEQRTNYSLDEDAAAEKHDRLRVLKLAKTIIDELQNVKTVNTSQNKQKLGIHVEELD